MIRLYLGLYGRNNLVIRGEEGGRDLGGNAEALENQLSTTHLLLCSFDQIEIDVLLDPLTHRHWLSHHTYDT